MPELPEVETVVRNLRAPLIGQTVTDMWYDWERTIHSPAPELFAERIKGQTFQAVKRRAKYILCELDHDVLVVHLKMTGRLYVTNADLEHSADKWVHFRLDLASGQQLRFSDMRKFGKVYLTHDINTITGKLGVEPLEDDFTADLFKSLIIKRKRAIKPLLLDQSVVAGIGNIYADEALHRANIHPLRLANSLDDNDIANLHHTIRLALNAGIEHEGASINWYRKPDGTEGNSQKHFYVYGRDGDPCSTCGTTIEKIRVAQRGTHYCPTCQPTPK